MASHDAIRPRAGASPSSAMPAWCTSSAPRIQGEAVSAILDELPSTFASFLTQFPREGDATVRLGSQSFLETRGGWLPSLYTTRATALVAAESPDPRGAVT
jgi:hypothetical protein